MKDNKVMHKFGGLYGLISILFGIMGDLVSFLLYPGYNFTKSAVSTLCKGPGGLFFQIGTVLSGVFAIPFVISLSKSFNENETNEKFRRAILYIAIVSCIAFIGLGAFCGSNLIISLIHGGFAVISWISGIIYVTGFNIIMYKDSKFSNSLAFIGFCASFILFSMIFLFILHFFPALRFLMIILPSLEWINTFSLIIWFLTISTYVIYKKI
ncbi:MAG: DUF998 domain-containing protein [Promethearchaeota archaeon]